jgi:dynein heavy chain
VRKCDELRQVIADINDMSVDAEYDVNDVQELYSLMEVYQLNIPTDEYDVVSTIRLLWEDLLDKAKFTNLQLVSVRKSFIEETKNLITEFAEEMRLFNIRFQESGPLAYGNDLQRGNESMKLFQKQLAEYELRRTSLAAAEKLFDLPVSVYTDFVNVSIQMQLMEPVFELYEQQLKSREQWGETLWVSLDVQALQDGVDRYITQLRKMPKVIKALSVHKAVELNLKDFRDSLPLLNDLKHEALRDRHWKHLMQQTGIEFEMKPDVFTLKSLFAMQLNQYVDAIGEILNSAIKELAIEKGIKEVEELWNNLKFTLIKYTKDNVDHGLVIGAIDEIAVALDDNCMQLQGMAASRYIGPFLNAVRNWEQVLSTISEVNF